MESKKVEKFRFCQKCHQLRPLVVIQDKVPKIKFSDKQVEEKENCHLLDKCKYCNDEIVLDPNQLLIF